MVLLLASSAYRFLICPANTKNCSPRGSLEALCRTFGKTSASLMEEVKISIAH